MLIIRHLCGDVDLSDEDEYEEICGDVKEMAAPFGTVRDVAIVTDDTDACVEPRFVSNPLQLEVGTVVIYFQTSTLSSTSSSALSWSSEGMEAAAAELDGRVVSGTKIDVTAFRAVESSVEASVKIDTGDGQTTNGSETGAAEEVGAGAAAAATAAASEVRLVSFVSADEVEDDDEYEEVCEDIVKMGTEFGTVVSVRVPRDGGGSGDGGGDNFDAVLVFETEEIAKRALNGLNGRLVGGKAIVAAIEGEEATAADVAVAAAADTGTETGTGTGAEAEGGSGDGDCDGCSVELYALVRMEKLEDPDEAEEVTNKQTSNTNHNTNASAEGREISVNCKRTSTKLPPKGTQGDREFTNSINCP